jgi:hypothetical protein
MEISIVLKVSSSIKYARTTQQMRMFNEIIQQRRLILSNSVIFKFVSVILSTIECNYRSN